MEKSVAKILIGFIVTIITFVLIVMTNNEVLLIPYFIGLTYISKKAFKYFAKKDEDLKKSIK